MYFNSNKTKFRNSFILINLINCYKASPPPPTFFSFFSIWFAFACEFDIFLWKIHHLSNWLKNNNFWYHYFSKISPRFSWSFHNFQHSIVLKMCRSCFWNFVKLFGYSSKRNPETKVITETVIHQWRTPVYTWWMQYTNSIIHSWLGVSSLNGLMFHYVSTCKFVRYCGSMQIATSKYTWRCLIDKPIICKDFGLNYSDIIFIDFNCAKNNWLTLLKIIQPSIK